MFEAVKSLAEAEWPDASPSITFKVTPSGLDVYADRDLLEPVLINLLRNAVHATRDVDQRVIEVQGRLNRRGNIVIEVIDNGTGVPEDIANKIFVPFFTTREGGSGVGLALARQVMIAHGGFVRLSNNDSRGATFSLTF
jgi:signal transduction histidine kinase